MQNINLSNKTKIIATVGPACSSREMLKELALTGVNVFRLNFSHGTHDIHKQVIGHIRSINEELGIYTTILQDLQGPKIRTTEVENGEVLVEEGQKLIITAEDIVGSKDKIGTTYKSLPNDVSIGDTILIDDGKIELKVTNIEGKNVHTEVIYGGPIKSRKGINLPDSNISAPSLTEKDERDLYFGLENDVDWIALSFVRKAADIEHLKKLIKERGKSTKVVAKIEKPEAIRNMDDIVAATDAVMIARGDLGVEIASEDVPMVQKIWVKKCNSASKPVIIATQMMESMIENPRPTRAETNDVANGVMDGADAVMLSAETASGRYPIQAVKSMYKTILSVEKEANIYDKHTDIHLDSPTFYNDHLVLTACRLSNETNAKVIIGMTKSGYTGFRLSGHRPRASIFIFTSEKSILTQLGLYWGLQGFYYDKMASIDETFDDVEQILRRKGDLQTGDVFITTASMPLHWENRTNMLKIKKVEG